VAGLAVSEPVARLREVLDELGRPAERPEVVVVLSHVAFERSRKAMDELAAMDAVAPGRYSQRSVTVRPTAFR
jgi:hypothetical protein